MDKNITLKKPKVDKTTIAMFAIMFVFGLMILMIGYTNPGLKQITGLQGSDTIFLALPQSIGLIIGTLTLKWLLSNFNIRTILCVGFASTLISITIISQLDKITGATGTTPTPSAQHKALIGYLILSFLMGLGISPSSPIASTYMSTVYTGHKKSQILSLSNSVYGIGGGIVPLSFATLIYNQQESHAAKFETLRYFYYIAMGFLLIALIVSLFTNYKHSKERLTTEIEDTTNSNNKSKNTKKDANSTKRHFWTAIILVGLMYVCYVTSETITNYSFVHYINPGKGEADKNDSITATTAFGLFLFVQGVWRAVSGVTLIKWIKLKYFIISSFMLVIIAFVILATGVVGTHKNLSYLVAILMAIGLGNVWPMMFSYGTGVNDKKAPLIGVCINIVSMSTLPVIQVISGPILNIQTYGPMILAIIGLTTAGLGAFVIWYLSIYLKTKKMEHPNDAEPSTFGKWLKSRSANKIKYRK